MTAPVAIRSAVKRFGSFTALGDVSLDIPAGEYVVLLGPSGCGKTTLLFAIGGFHDLDGGVIEIGGRDMAGVPPARRPTTTMFQDYALFPHMSLTDNVAFGPRMRGVARRERRERAAEMLSLVGLPDAGARRPHELSGGQRQRVALARALAVEPDVLLLDEPLGALDLKLRRQMQDELKAIQGRVGTTFVHVTHDQEEAMAIADRIVVMNAGRIEDVGEPERVYDRPATRFAAGFMGEINFIEATGAGGTARTPLGPVPVEADGPLTLAIRPERFREHGPDALDLGEATVLDHAFFGTHTRAHVRPGRAPDMTLVTHLPHAHGGERVRDGDRVPLRVDAGAIVVLPERGTP